MPNDLETLNNIVALFDQGREALTKFAFTPMGAPQGPAMAPPPGDPAAQGGMPPQGDPNAQGGMPPVDPNTGMPIDPATGQPMDPNAQGGMPPQGDPAAQGGMPPADPAAQGGGGAVSPELENALSQMSSSVESVANTVEEQQAHNDELTKRMLSMEDELSKLREELKAPAPFEGGGNADNGGSEKLQAIAQGGAQ